MLDPQLLRNEPERVRVLLARRRYELDLDKLAALEGARKTLQSETENLRSDRNKRSKAIGQAKARGEDIGPLRDAVAALGERLKERQLALESVQADLEAFALELPNLPRDDVPDGVEESDNTEVRRVGATPEFAFAPRDHVDLGAHLARHRF